MISTNEAHRTALSVSLIQERRHCCDTPLWLLPAGKLNVARNLRVRFGCKCPSESLTVCKFRLSAHGSRHWDDFSWVCIIG